MCIDILSVKRGILSFYDGSKYIIYSQFYGVVAESTDIRRNDDRSEVEIDFDICEWYGYWDIKPIITKGINKFEKQFIDKKVKINYNKVKGKSENSLDKYIHIELLER